MILDEEKVMELMVVSSPLLASPALRNPDNDSALESEAFECAKEQMADSLLKLLLEVLLDSLLALVEDLLTPFPFA